jgi:predicted flap endonuclease-1-like 5' DNA nuclease
MAASDSLLALFRELCQLTVLEEGSPNAFRVRAYENAIEAISSHRGDLKALSEKELTAIDGIGPSTARKIREFFEGGTISKLEALRQKYPPEFVELSRIPGLGPKTLLRLKDELGVRNLDDLRAALLGRKVREIRGLGAKVEEKPSTGWGRPARTSAVPSPRPCPSPGSSWPPSERFPEWSASSTAGASGASGRPWPTWTSSWPRASRRPCGRRSSRCRRCAR